MRTGVLKSKMSLHGVALPHGKSGFPGSRCIHRNRKGGGKEIGRYAKRHNYTPACIHTHRCAHTTTCICTWSQTHGQTQDTWKHAETQSTRQGTCTHSDTRARTIPGVRVSPLLATPMVGRVPITRKHGSGWELGRVRKMGRQGYNGETELLFRTPPN